MEEEKIYRILKRFLVEARRVNYSLDEFYSIIEQKDARLRDFLNYPSGIKNFRCALEKLEGEGVIEPVKSSKFNAHNLRQKYKKKKKEEDLYDRKELLLNLHSSISLDDYLKDMKEFEKDKEYIFIIDDFLRKVNNIDKEKYIVSINERAFELFGDEKFFRGSSKTRSKGEGILAKLGLDVVNDLNCYRAYEPFFFFSREDYKKKSVRKILIVENKDTFWSFKKGVLERGKEYIDFLIYGEGNKIVSSFQFCEEHSLKATDEFLYFGDIDAEGINIFFKLKEAYPNYNITPFLDGYIKLLEVMKNKECPRLNKSQIKKQDNLDLFCEYFSSDDAYKIRNIILHDRYIPQEAFSFELIKKYM